MHNQSIRYIFESTVPPALSESALAARADAWVAAGLDTIMIQVDDGRGSTWPTTAWQHDTRDSEGATQRTVAYLHSRGLRVIACVSLANYMIGSPYPHLQLDQFSGSMYNFWSSEFRDRRVQCLVDLANSCDFDGIALDYLRTGREAVGSAVSAIEATTTWLQAARSAIPQHVALLGVHAAPFATLIQQGITLTAWLNAGLLTTAVLFDYAPTFPSTQAQSLASAVGAHRVWPLIGNYTYANNTASPVTGLALSHNWRQVSRQVNPGGLGVYLANLLTPEQVTILRHTDLRL